MVITGEMDDIDAHPHKRVRLQEEVDSAYASQSSPAGEHESQDLLFGIGVDVASSVPDSVTTTASRRPKTFHCSFDGCDKVYDRPARLEIHIRSHTKERPFVCNEPDCDKAFARMEHLKAHVTAKHSDTRNYICDYTVSTDENGEPVACGKSFHTGTRLRRHIAAHEDKEQTKCQECGQLFRKQETLQRHIRAEHLGENAFRCKHLDDSSEECGKTFATVSQLKTHEGKEHGNARYFCEMCPLVEGLPVGFTTYTDLQAHLQLAHPPSCTICGLECLSKRALKAHIDIVHQALEDRQRFDCKHPGCGKKFTKKGNMEVHFRTVHANEKKFTCGQHDLSDSTRVPGWTGLGCGQSFGTKASLEGHIRTQHLSLPVSSKMDGVSLRAKSAANGTKSVSVITGHGYEDTRPFTCLQQSCQSRFKYEYELVVHLELTHGWNIDDINDTLAETAALQGDKFWIGGHEEQEDLLPHYLTNSFGRDPAAAQQDIDPALD